MKKFKIGQIVKVYGVKSDIINIIETIGGKLQYLKVKKFPYLWIKSTDVIC